MAYKSVVGDIHGMNLHLSDDIVIWDDTDLVYFFQNHIADEYDKTRTYNTGDIYYVHYTGLYRCTQDNVTGEWDSSKCTQTTLATELADIRANAGGTKWYQHQLRVNDVVYYLLLPFATSLLLEAAYTETNAMIIRSIIGENANDVHVYFRMDVANKRMSCFNFDGSTEFSDMYREDMDSDTVTAI